MALRAKKYFRDYDVEVKSVNGKERRICVYKGDLYARELTDRARTAERIAYLAAALLAAAILVIAMLQPVASNVAGFFAACSILALIPAFCTAEGAAEAFFRKGNLTEGNYRERLIMLRVMPVAGAVLTALMAVGYLMCLVQGAALSAGLPALGCALAAAVCYAGVAVREFRVGYRVIKGARSTGEDPAARQDETEE